MAAAPWGAAHPSVPSGDAAASADAALAAAARDDDDDDDDDDDEVECTGANERVYVHARYDCKAYPFAGGDHARHCDKCWCASCGVAASACTQWAAHCSTSRQAAAAAIEAERAATRLQRLNDAPWPAAPPGQLQVGGRATSARSAPLATRLHTSTRRPPHPLQHAAA
eukprot:4062245-Prymnesium_polylepis.1